MSTKKKTKKKRIFQIAKELNISHMDIINFLKEEEIPCKGVNSAVSEEVYYKILENFSEEKNVVERIRKEKARKKAEEKRKKEEEARKKAREKQEKIESDLISKKEDNFRQNIDTLYKESRNKVKSFIKKKKKKTKEKESQKKQQKSKSKQKKQKKKNLKRISREEIERKLGKKSGKKKKKNKKKKQVDSDKVDSTFKKTMAKMKGGDTKKTSKKKKKSKDEEEEKSEEDKTFKISEYSTVQELAEMISEEPTDVVQKCVEMGMFVTVNQRLDFDTIALIADEFGYEAEKQEHYGEELLQEEEEEEDLENAKPRPPVVTVMGHVDHGKTTLLDRIREANVVAGESGGITQHIGAYQVKLDDGEKITFLDTPGHEAFTTMRARGAQVTDLVVLMVAADDSVMPQTIEAINHAKSADVPMIVAINKMDRPQADAEKVRRELSEKSVLVESWGGEVQEIEMSALEGEGVDELLESILLEAEMMELKANPDADPRGTVIEAKVDKKRGPTATILLEKGTLEVGDPFVCGASCGRVRAMYDERDNKVEKVRPAEPVTLVGFDEVPKLADKLIGVEDINEAREIASERQRIKREEKHRKADKVTSLDELSSKIAEGKTKTLNIVLKGDVDGSVEAISETLTELGNEEVSVNISHKSAGTITENDIMLAKASDAIIIGFNVSTNPKVKEAAKRENVEIRKYEVIYELVEDVKAALEGLLSPEKIEVPIGKAEVRAVFGVPDIGNIAGCYVTDGKVHRDARARLKRDGEEIYEGDISSLKRFEEDAREVKEGYECGINIHGCDEYEEGDIIEVYKVKNKRRKLEQ